jgi:5-methyltetrahydropteroyltriglutamate--homocysteine methyltransferase
MDGFSGAQAYAREGGKAGFVHPRGHILHDILEARVMPDLVGPVGRGTLQFTPIWKAAQRLTTRPVKFGTITPELIAMAVRDFHYKDLRKAIMAVSDALNEELRELVDAGCRVVQMEEPQIHMLAV